MPDTSSALPDDRQFGPSLLAVKKSPPVTSKRLRPENRKTEYGGPADKKFAQSLRVEEELSSDPITLMNMFMNIRLDAFIRYLTEVGDPQLLQEYDARNVLQFLKNLSTLEPNYNSSELTIGMLLYMGKEINRDPSNDSYYNKTRFKYHSRFQAEANVDTIVYIVSKLIFMPLLLISDSTKGTNEYAQ